MPKPFAAAWRCLRRLAYRSDGNVAMIFGLFAIPIIIAAGMAIDLAQAYMVKVRLGSALDAAALAVGSERNQTQAQLLTDLQNYFKANYPSTDIGQNVTVAPVPANADLTAAVVDYQAQATVPMYFMPLIGINTINVSVTAETKKNATGVEVAIVLDNTGSMLCGPNDGAPNYSDGQCGGGVVSSDTTCTNVNNQSRICTLINAATQFVNTLTAQSNLPQSLYISVVPYVTTVNVGNSFCTGATTCSHITTTTDACTGTVYFTDYHGTSISNYLINTGATPVAVTGHTSNGGSAITSISPNTTNLKVGMLISGSGIPANTLIKTINSASQITICKNATATASGVNLTAYSPVTYDTTQTATTQNWMGCVVEPTSADENSVGGVINSAVVDPDFTEPGGGWPSWYPMWWAPDSANAWPTVQAQNNTTETQGLVLTDWQKFDGPNQGCPVPTLPLTDATTAAGKTTLLNTISSMWPRDSGGTQVHIGMIWGWRVLSPNGPFPANNGHPLDYATASSTGWKKVVVLMTDGTEEWPVTDNMTGLGQIADGKIGTTSTNTAVTNLNARLQSVCSNMASSGNFIIYTIGLGSDGASNTQLQNCATTSNGGFFVAATPSNLASVFNSIAKGIGQLRLSK